MSRGDWYDRFAPIYDVATLGDMFYRKARRNALDELNLRTGSNVLDLFCGTGVDLPLLSPRIGSEGRVIAVDGSADMLEKAKRRRPPGPNRVDFIQADLSATSCDDLLHTIETDQPAHAFFSLGLTCLDNWYDFSASVFEVMPTGSRIVVMDVHSEHRTLGARMIDWIGAAECSRPVWKALEEKGENFRLTRYRPFKIVDVSVVVASATKRR